MQSVCSLYTHASQRDAVYVNVSFSACAQFARRSAPSGHTAALQRQRRPWGLLHRIAKYYHKKMLGRVLLRCVRKTMCDVRCRARTTFGSSRERRANPHVARIIGVWLPPPPPLRPPSL